MGAKLDARSPGSPGVSFVFSFQKIDAHVQNSSCVHSLLDPTVGLWLFRADEVRQRGLTRSAGYSTTSTVPSHPSSSLRAPRPSRLPRTRSSCSMGRTSTPGRRLKGARRGGRSQGFMEIAPGTGPIDTKAKFGDVQLHVEWASPNPPGGKGQDRGNSGIFLMGVYELQVLDSYHADTYADGQAGAIYGQYPPLANASRPPGEWQTYDVAFRRPRFDKSGKLMEPARITLIHNGILVQNNEEPWGGTNWLEPAPYDAQADRGPIELQDHDHPVRFRNFWVRELPERAAPPAGYPDRKKTISLSAAQLDVLTGQYATGQGADAKPVTISRGDGHLLFKLASRPRPAVVLPVSATEFVFTHADARLNFERDQEGRVTAIQLKVGDGEQVLKKIAPSSASRLRQRFPSERAVRRGELGDLESPGRRRYRGMSGSSRSWASGSPGARLDRPGRGRSFARACSPRSCFPTRRGGES